MLPTISHPDRVHGLAVHGTKLLRVHRTAVDKVDGVPTAFLPPFDQRCRGGMPFVGTLDVLTPRNTLNSQGCDDSKGTVGPWNGVKKFFVVVVGGNVLDFTVSVHDFVCKNAFVYEAVMNRGTLSSETDHGSTKSHVAEFRQHRWVEAVGLEGPDQLLHRNARFDPNL